ncbi:MULTISPECIES: hypothetical protein [Burkholderia]|uniref:hypothetical protein n=1 Tax=Burkholderia TaxID=32008 RepID=UPI00157AACC7|nr:MULTISPECIES: hypothetical protein [Burkholderia]
MVEHDLVSILVLLAVLMLAVLFFAEGRSRNRIRGQLQRKSARRPRSHTHRHP